MKANLNQLESLHGRFSNSHFDLKKNLIRLILLNRKNNSRKTVEFYLTLNLSQLTFILDKVNEAKERKLESSFIPETKQLQFA